MLSIDIDTFNEQSENKEDTIEIFQEKENIDFYDDIKEENNICISQYNKKGKEYKDLESSKLQNTTLHKGPKVKYQEIYNKFMDFIEFNKKLFNPVITWSSLLKMYEIEPSRKNINIK